MHAFSTAVLLIAAGTVASGDAHAQGQASDYPNRPVRFVVPYPPGGNTDVFARMIGMRLSERMGQQFVMDNRAGAAGTVGADLVARSAPDGYTILMGTFGNIIVARALNPKLPYDPVAAFSPVCSVASPPGLLVSHPSVPVSTVKELIAYARANPGKLNYGTPGSGAWNHLFFELLKERTGMNIVHVPYKGIGPAMVDLVGGHVQTAISSIPGALVHVKANRLRALAATGETRSTLLPDVPTVSEAGVPGYRAAGWFAVLAPAKTPVPIIAKLNAEIAAILKSPEMAKALLQEGAEPNPAPPDVVARSIREQVAQWEPVVRSLGL